MASEALLAAQAELLRRRVEATGKEIPDYILQPTATSVALKLANEQLLRLRQAATGAATATTTILKETDVAIHNCNHNQFVCQKVTTTAPTETPVFIYPSITKMAKQTGTMPAYRLWLICRHLDQAGRGIVTAQQIKEATGTIFTWRRCRQILPTGNGVYWQYDTNNDRLVLLSPSSVVIFAQKRGINFGLGVRVKITNDNFLWAGHANFNATVYSAFHAAARTEANPISRENVKAATGGVSRTSQKRYEKNRVNQLCNFAILPANTDLKDAAAANGNAITSFYDYYGHHGQPRATAVAQRLPNSYKSKVAVRGNRGTQRRHAKRIAANLDRMMGQGNGGRKTNRLFFDRAVDAYESYNKTGVAFWRKTSKEAANNFWYILQ